MKSAAAFYRRNGGRKSPPATPAPAKRIRTAIGEMGIQEPNGREIVLRPSLYAMTQLGEPDEIVRVLANVCGVPANEQGARLQRLDAMSVIAACTSEDVRHLTGYHDGQKLVPGLMEPMVMIVLARRLLRHGITGTLPEQPREPGAGGGPQYVDHFDARGYVATAMAHLGVSENDAWDLTMTGLIGAMRSKYPPAPKDPNRPGANAPSKAEYKAAMEWHDKIRQARSAKNG